MISINGNPLGKLNKLLLIAYDRMLFAAAAMIALYLDLLARPVSKVYTRKVDTIEEAAALPCFIRANIDYIPMWEVVFSVAVKKDMGYEMGIYPQSPLYYLTNKPFFDCLDDILGRFGEFEIKACDECNSYRQGNADQYEKGGLSSKTRKWCPAAVVETQNKRPVGNIAASTAGDRLAHDGNLYEEPTDLSTVVYAFNQTLNQEAIQDDQGRTRRHDNGYRQAHSSACHRAQLLKRGNHYLQLPGALVQCQ